jgi:hypothetical protein
MRLHAVEFSNRLTGEIIQRDHVPGLAVTQFRAPVL